MTSGSHPAAGAAAAGSRHLVSRISLVHQHDVQPPRAVGAELDLPDVRLVRSLSK